MNTNDNDTQPKLESSTEVREACDNAIEQVNDAEVGSSRPKYEAFIEPLAVAYVDDIIHEPVVDECLTRLKDADGPLTKPILENMFEEYEGKHTPESEKLQPLESWLRSRCDTVTEHKHDDTGITEYYTWHITHDGEEYEVDSEHEHNNWDDFTTLLNKRKTGFGFDEPENYRNMRDWKSFIYEFIDRRGEINEVTGPRSHAIEELKNRLEVSQVYTSIDKANTHSRGVFMEDEFDDVMYISGSLVSTIAEEHGLKNTNVLQSELKKRGHVDSGVSTVFTLENGQDVRFWELPVTFADVQFQTDDDNPAGSERALCGAGDD